MLSKETSSQSLPPSTGAWQPTKAWSHQSWHAKLQFVLPYLLMAIGLIAGVSLGARLSFLAWQHHLARIRLRAVKDLKQFSQELSDEQKAKRRHAEAELSELKHQLDERYQQSTMRQLRRQKNHDERLLNLQKKDQRLGQKSLKIAAQRDATEKLRQQQREQQKATNEGFAYLQYSLAGRAGVDFKNAREQHIDKVCARHEVQIQTQVRQRLARFEQQEVPLAQSTISKTLERYSGVGHLERIQNTFALNLGDILPKLLEEETPVSQLLKEKTGCHFVHHPRSESLIIRGDDPLGRELCRRVITEALKKNITRDRPLMPLLRRHQRYLRKELDTHAQRAFITLELPNAHPEIMHLVGRLQWRLSYSQNQWKHALEAAHLAEMLARELGLDPTLAKRGALLHDIGKSMTHDHEGSHAVLGAEVARRCGEDEIICNAIGSHHGDEDFNTPYAHLVTAADALSGARPGARRESATQYIDLVAGMMTIAKAASPAVEGVDIMQGGRELRVRVAGLEQDAKHSNAAKMILALDELPDLAATIAEEIESSLSYAGQIRVTVIQESKAQTSSF